MIPPALPIGFAGGSATGLSVIDAACGPIAADDAPNLGTRNGISPFASEHWNHKVLFRPFSSLTTAL
jgi:hypothetical protein